MNLRFWFPLLLMLTTASLHRPADGQDPDQETPWTDQQLRDFETQIRPLLHQHCVECHGPTKQKGGLRVDGRSWMIEGGDSGPAIEPGAPEASLLMEAIDYQGLEMPPSGQLPEALRKKLREWIAQGAPWPDETDSPDSPGGSDSKEGHLPQGTDHWAFRPLHQPALPQASPSDPHPLDHPIDRWIHARLDEKGLSALPRATSRQLVRRVHFTLTGLPPDPDWADLWANRIDADGDRPFDPQGYLEMVDHLLAHPAYGEHWGRHWLDVVRFGQSNGYERDGDKPYSWRYRDYVVSAFQKDLPYNRFVMEQIAGDELPDVDASSLAATGFYRLGVWDDEPDDKRQAEFDDLDDVMVGIGAAFLGTTIGCARCHDHKLEPMTQQEYYQLLAFIRSIRPYNTPEPHRNSPSALPLASRDQLLAAQEKVQQQRKRLEEHLALATEPTQRKSIEEQIANLSLGDFAWTLGVREMGADPIATTVLVRGQAAQLGREVSPDFPKMMNGSSDFAKDLLADRLADSQPLQSLFPTTGRRLQLARWLAHPQHPLVARTLVNRLWHHHFGRGLAATTSDLGLAGTPPTHPELIDWLAVELQRRDWSIQQMHRLILTSETFQRSSHLDDSAATRLAMQTDPANQWRWRFDVRRIGAESVRDSMLLVSGELNRRIGGEEMYPRLSGEVLAGQSKPGLGWRISPASEQARRSLYAVVKRSLRDPLLEAFDYSNTTSPLAERPITTVAPQALLLLHGHFTQQRASALARRLADHRDNPHQQILELYRLVFQRTPTEPELREAVGLLMESEAHFREHAEEIVFRPDVPESLFGGFRQSLPAERFLEGPRIGWEYRAGSWGGGYEGIDVVDPYFGPHAFWEGTEAIEGQWEGELTMEPATLHATLLLRGSPDGDKWNAIAVRLDRARQQVVLLQQEGTTVREAAIHHPLNANQPISLRVLFDADQIRLWIDRINAPQPALRLSLDPSLSRPGRAGIAVWGGSVTLHSMRWSSGQQSRMMTPRQIGRPSESGPPGWTSYDGRWSLTPQGTLSIDPHQGAKLLWDDHSLQDGRLEVEMKMTEGKANIGGLIARVSEPKIGADNWLGYEISLNMERRTILFGEHRNNWKPLAEVPAPIRPDSWHRLEVRFSGNRIAIHLDGGADPLIVHDAADLLPGTQLGLRTWGSQIEYRDLRLTNDQGVQQVTWNRPDGNAQPQEIPVAIWARQQALELVCRTLLNLNEFLYVD
jgi:mono/diheme cytochrome c family protein